jgi:hypothetical protein
VLIDQPLLNNVPEGEPEGLEVYELKQRIARLENAIEEAGSWLSAAQECEKTCLECKQAFLNLINIKAKGGAE